MALIMTNNPLAWKVRNVPDAAAAAAPTFSMTSQAPLTSLDGQVPSPSWAWTTPSWNEFSPPALYGTRTPSPEAGGAVYQPPPTAAHTSAVHQQFGCEAETAWTVNCLSFSFPRELENVNLGQHQQQQQQRDIYRFQQLSYPSFNIPEFPVASAASSDNPAAAVKGMCATEARAGEPSSGHGAPELDSVLSIVMRQVNEEIRSTCEVLGIHPDPCKWSVDDVKAWILWTCRQCALSVSLDLFAMDGSSLSQLTVESFRQRAPQAGDTLHAKLDIWRSAYQQTASAEPAEENFSIGEMLNWLNSSSQDPQPSGPGYASFSSASMIPHSGVGQQQPMASPYSEIAASESDVPNEDDIGDDDSLPGDVRSGRSSSSSSGGSHIHLWQFLKELLSHPQENGTAIRWLDRQRGVFKIEDSVRVAKLWGKRKNRPAMNYDKLSRSIRQYYRKGIMKKTERSQRLVYQFCHPYFL